MCDLACGTFSASARRHVMELDTGRHGITDRFRRAGLRLWHVQVFEYNLFDYEAFSAVRLMVREAGAITGLVLELPFNLRQRGE